MGRLSKKRKAAIAALNVTRRRHSGSSVSSVVTVADTVSEPNDDAQLVRDVVIEASVIDVAQVPEQSTLPREGSVSSNATSSVFSSSSSRRLSKKQRKTALASAALEARRSKENQQSTSCGSRQVCEL